MAKRVPYEFILDHLMGVDATIKPMFGNHVVHVEGKVVLYLIDRPGDPDNGICLATTAETIPSLERAFPSLRPQVAYGPEATDWRLLPADADDFEESVVKACELIVAGDPRIGREPKSRRGS